MLGTLFCYGYDVVVGSDLSRDSSAHTTVFFKLRDPRIDYMPLHYYSHKFICIAPYSTGGPVTSVSKTLLKLNGNQAGLGRFEIQGLRMQGGGQVKFILWKIFAHMTDNSSSTP